MVQVVGLRAECASHNPATSGPTLTQPTEQRFAARAGHSRDVIKEHGEAGRPWAAEVVSSNECDPGPPRAGFLAYSRPLSRSDDCGVRPERPGRASSTPSGTLPAGGACSPPHASKRLEKRFPVGAVCVETSLLRVGGDNCERCSARALHRCG